MLCDKPFRVPSSPRLDKETSTQIPMTCVPTLQVLEMSQSLQNGTHSVLENIPSYYRDHACNSHRLVATSSAMCSIFSFFFPPLHQLFCLAAPPDKNKDLKMGLMWDFQYSAFAYVAVRCRLHRTSAISPAPSGLAALEKLCQNKICLTLVKLIGLHPKLVQTMSCILLGGNPGGRPCQ